MPDTYFTRFFLGANTPTGFFGYHETDLYDPRDGWAAFLIKSGAGTGKATFMREVANELSTLGLTCEAIFCSSDPDSLDAVIFREIKLCVADATSPHIIEPTAYGECEQLVPFGCCLMPDKTLSQTDAWFEAADACAGGHARCCRFMAAAGSLLENNRRIANEHILGDKLCRSAERLAAREFGTKRHGCGRETRRFLSAVTPKGHLFLSGTAAALCPKLYILEDEYGAVSSMYIRELREHALKAGLDIITCSCPLSPLSKPEHLLIPSLGVGFLTSNSLHTVDFPVFRRIHATRFLSENALKPKKQQLGFNRRASRELLAEAVKAAADAKAHHDRMEDLHIGAMDWQQWREIADKAMEQIFRIARNRMENIESQKGLSS